MIISRYSCALLGEDVGAVSRLHPSTIRRLRAWSLSLHIPMALWAGTSLLMARQIFAADVVTALWAAAGCTALICCLERLILAAPKSKWMAFLRVAIGLLTAVLGASAIDLFMFDKEISGELHARQISKLEQAQGAKRLVLRGEVEQAKQGWQQSRQAAQCEGNGTCGSRVRSAGPLYHDLLQHSQKLRADYDRAVTNLEIGEANLQRELAALTPDLVKAEAGMLNRLHALHDFIGRDWMALTLWLTFFLFMLALELSVVIAKFAFGQTVDDVIEQVREEADRLQAIGYLDAVTSPLAGAHQQLGVTYQ